MLRNLSQQQATWDLLHTTAPPPPKMWKIMFPRGYTSHRRGRRHKNTTTTTTTTTTAGATGAATANNPSPPCPRHHRHHHHRHRGHPEEAAAAAQSHAHNHHHHHRHHHDGSSPGRRTNNHKHHKHQGKKCCRACQAPIGTVTVNGHRARGVAYCQRHNCAKVEAGGTSLCTMQNNGRTAFCDHRECFFPSS